MDVHAETQTHTLAQLDTLLSLHAKTAVRDTLTKSTHFSNIQNDHLFFCAHANIEFYRLNYPTIHVQV